MGDSYERRPLTPTEIANIQFVGSANDAVHLTRPVWYREAMLVAAIARIAAGPRAGGKARAGQALELWLADIEVQRQTGRGSACCVSVGLDEDSAEALAMWAAEAGMTQAEWLSAVVRDGIENEGGMGAIRDSHRRQMGADPTAAPNSGVGTRDGYPARDGYPKNEKTPDESGV